MQDFLAAFDALPLGSFRARYADKAWQVSRTDLAGGKAQKLVAHEPGGPGYVSLNLYRLASGARPKPCEMPEAEAVAFVLGVVPDLT